jgi:23S rRNA (uracil1939-C5)-methyltransferase
VKKLALEVDVAEMAPGGEGVAICEIAGERRAVFVRGAAPGERVEVEIDPSRRPAPGRLLALVSRSAARVEPPCRHVERCGGCDWMFLSPAAQQHEHGRMAVSLLGEDAATKASHAAARALAYRTRARVHVQAKRGRVVVGMFAHRSHEPADVDTCVVLDPVLDEARRALAGWLAGAVGRGEAQIALGHPATLPRKAVVDLRWTGDLPPAAFGRFERAVADGTIAGVRLFVGDVRKPATIGDATPWIAGADDLPLRLAPGGFSQATEDGNVLLARRVAELARGLPAGSCVELFAGAGNLTVLLAREREVVAVEQDHDACVAARENLTARGLTARVVEADANTHAIPKGVSLVVLDPPREGARAVAAELASRAQKHRAPAVVYVACDLPTLARDVKLLTAAGYEMQSVETFEMFPHTSHVETVVVLTPPVRGS